MNLQETPRSEIYMTNEGFICSICRRAFESEGGARRHMTRIHINGAEITDKTIELGRIFSPILPVAISAVNAPNFLNGTMLTLEEWLLANPEY